MGEVVERAFSERGLEVDTWNASPEEMEPYIDHVGEQSSYENRPNVAGLRRGSGGGRSILLNAHIDTVDPGDPAAWTEDPLSGTVEGDLLYGRGSCDMKGGLVTHLIALDALSDLGLGLRGDVTVAATVGEENGGLGALSTVLRGYRADAALITEPTRLALVPAQGGSLVFRLKVPGPLGPRRRPRRGRLGAGEVRPHLRGTARAGAGAQRHPQPPALRRTDEQGAHQHGRRAGRQLGLDRPRVARRRGARRPDPRRRSRSLQGPRRRTHRRPWPRRDPWLGSIRPSYSGSAASSPPPKSSPTPRSARP